MGISLFQNYMAIRGGSRAAATSMMKCFVIIVNGFQLLTIITKCSILDNAAGLDPPWQSKENQVLDCQFENRNSYAMFAIKTCDPRGTMVGHLPREVLWCNSICYAYRNTS